MDISLFEHEEDLKYAANYLLNQEVLSGAAEGIAKRIVDKGWSSLTDKQKEVFEKFALPMAKKTCENCGCDIPYCELEFFDGICSYCAHVWSKMEKE